MKYCAFLRGVNVKGTAMKMAEVCKVFTDAGMTEVSSVLASGNIIFSSDLNISELKKNLEESMSKLFNYDAFLFLKTENEVSEIVAKNPFLKREDLHTYVFVGTDGIEKTLSKAFESSVKTEKEEGKTVETIFYWQVPKGNTLDSAFGKILGTKSLKDQLTSRNINTFEKIMKKFNS